MLVESFLVDPNSLPLLQEWALPFELNRRDGPTSFEIVAGDFKDGILGSDTKAKDGIWIHCSFSFLLLLAKEVWMM